MDKHIPETLIAENGRVWEFREHKKGSAAPLSYKMRDENVGLVIPQHIVETDFTRKGRPEPKTSIVVQGKYECAAASLAMLVDAKLFHAKRAMAKMHWRNDDKGACDDVIIGAARLLGRDLIRVKHKEITKDIGPCSITVKSLNVKGMCHAITWNGEEMLDPNWGRPGRKFWGCEWAPWTMDTRGALVLLDKNLTQAERDEYDEAVRAREEKAIMAIKLEVLKALKEAS